MIPIEAKIEALTPIESSTGEAMSATFVRKFAVEHDLDDFRAFLDGHFDISPPIGELMQFLPGQEGEAFFEKYRDYIQDNGTFDFAYAFWSIIRYETTKAKAAQLKEEEDAKAKAPIKRKAKDIESNMTGPNVTGPEGGFKSRKNKQSRNKRKQPKKKQTKKRRKRQTKKR
jgi:hypothetical protein